jgi:HNH endonuclease
VLAVLQRFDCDIGSFNGERVHSLINVITLEKNIHDAFDRLLFYFEATVGLEFYALNHDTHRVPCHSLL